MELQHKKSPSFPVKAFVARRKIYYTKTFKHGSDVIVACNDVLSFLESVPPSTARLIITSPHYNLGKTHEKPLPLDEYLEWQRTVIEKCNNVLKNGGSICWQSGNYVKNGEVFPLDVFFYKIFKDLGLKLRNRIIWHFEHEIRQAPIKACCERSIPKKGEYTSSVPRNIGLAERLQIDGKTIERKTP